ncbi:MAG TPA: hypothetical protein VJ914_09070 [Pseudonocardiaceae bacterium]|nr:hypothetical protein [Pseudonocardiaceae bacterium]
MLRNIAMLVDRNPIDGDQAHHGVQTARDMAVLRAMAMLSWVEVSTERKSFHAFHEV